MNIWSHIHKCLDDKKRVVLMVVIESEGSSPGHKGFKMAVCEDGSLFGTLGGGIMEHKLVEMAKTHLTNRETFNFSIGMEHNADAGEKSSGMICSGQQAIAFYPLDEDKIEIIRALESFTQKPRPFYIWYTERGISVIPDMNSFEKNPYVKTAFNSWEFVESLSDTGRLYIFGAGHVGLALSRTMQNLGFYIELFDDRDWIDTFIENTFVAKKQIVDYQHIDQLVPEGSDVYAVIMTYNHRGDEIVLRQLLGKNIRYLGMMGSKSKVKTLFDMLLKDGYTPEDLEKVHSPVGLPINSLSPAEIAISIAAEIISVKNGN